MKPRRSRRSPGSVPSTDSRDLADCAHAILLVSRWCDTCTTACHGTPRARAATLFSWLTSLTWLRMRPDATCCRFCSSSTSHPIPARGAISVGQIVTGWASASRRSRSTSRCCATSAWSRCARVASTATTASIRAPLEQLEDWLIPFLASDAVGAAEAEPVVDDAGPAVYCAWAGRTAARRRSDGPRNGCRRRAKPVLPSGEPPPRSYQRTVEVALTRDEETRSAPADRSR